MATDILQRIVQANQPELLARKAATPLAELAAQIPGLPPPPSFTTALRQCAASGKPAVIAELKSASPSKGVIRAPLDCGGLSIQLQEAGAAALSVLTEPHFFKGSLENLRIARKSCAIPLLRKDFIVDEYQLYEARCAGASAVLLIAALLDDRQLRELSQCAQTLSLEVLAESHNEEEVERILNNVSGTFALGVNARNLRTFKTSLEDSSRVLRCIPAGNLAVAESAVTSREDMDMLTAAGAGAFLIGETLMRAPCPGEKLRQLLKEC